MGCFYISPHPSQTLFLPSICFLPANLEHLIFMEGSVKAAHRPTPVSVLLHMVSPLARLRTLDLRAMPLQPLFRLHSLRASCIFSLT